MAMAKNWIAHLKILFFCLFCFVCWVQLRQQFVPNFSQWDIEKILNNNIYSCCILLYSLGTFTCSEKKKKRKKTWKQYITDNKILCIKLFCNFIWMFKYVEINYLKMNQQKDSMIFTVVTQVSSFNFDFSKDGTYSREALFRGRRTLNISKRHQNTFNLSL